MSEGSYHWTNYEHNEYETLFRPDGTEVTTITEPEDRNFYRDLAPVCIELNALQAENARLREAIGLATTAAPTMEMDAADPVGMMQRVVAEVTRLREQVEALAGALEAVSEDASKNHDPRCTDELISGFVMENARVALRAYREARQ